MRALINELKSEGKRPLGKPKHGREDNNKEEFYETVYEGLKLIHLAQGRNQWRFLEKTMTNLMVQLNYGKTDFLFAVMSAVKLLLIYYIRVVIISGSIRM
jgi:hypothetical protein